MVTVAAVDESDVGIGPVTVREYDARDRAAVDRLERSCEVGPTPSGGGKKGKRTKLCLFTDLLGDPLCRVRHSPASLMLVAESASGHLLGVVRGCVKTVSCGARRRRPDTSTTTTSTAAAAADDDDAALFSKVAYLLGLRVSPAHRRRGIGRALVARMEEWFRRAGAEYAYVATDHTNEPCVRLFTSRCGYAKFRSPSVLVHPVFRHDVAPSRHGARVLQLPPRDAEVLYRHRFAAVEFFPHDIGRVLNNPLSLGTFLAVPDGSSSSVLPWRGAEAFLAAPPASWAVASVWNSSAAFRLELRGAPRLWRVAARATRAADRVLSRLLLRVPSVPNLFEPFGMHVVYGLGGDGADAPRMATALCRHAHNVARRGGASVVATEVAACDPLRAGVPHWRRLGAEDLWCIKRLKDGYGEDDGALGDWTKAPPGESIFVDPREF